MIKINIYNALIKAIEYRNLQIVESLIEKETDINIKNNEDKTALDFVDTDEIKEMLREVYGE